MGLYSLAGHDNAVCDEWNALEHVKETHDE